MKMIVLLSALAGCASVVFAQGTLPPYPLESEIRLEVWNGTSWGNTVNASPGQQVEYRVVMNYTGPRTDLLGLGGARYQVSFSNADNSGASRDNLAAFPDEGVSTYFRNLLMAADGANGAPLTSYGRVTYGINTQSFTNQNRLTNFRHGGDFPQGGALAGSWLRVAGEFVSEWPASTLSASEATATDVNRIARGVIAAQLSQFRVGDGAPNTNFVGGVHDIVVFRHAITLSDLDVARTMELSIVEGSLQRAGSVNSGDDRRFIAWHEQVIADIGSFRTSVAIVPATIVIPTPGVLAVVGLSGMLAARRRR